MQVFDVKDIRRKSEFSDRKQRRKVVELENFIKSNSSSAQDFTNLSVVQGLGADGKIFVVKEGESIKTTCIAARSYLNQNPNSEALVIVLQGVYKEYEINQNDVPMYFYDGAIVWTDVSARSIISDRHIGANTIVRIYGQGIFQHKNSFPANDQEAVNMQNANCDVYIQAKHVGHCQLWNSSFQKIVFEDVQFYTSDDPFNRAKGDVQYINCTFMNGLGIAGYNNSESRFYFDNCTFILPKKWFGAEVKDADGNTIFEVTFLGNDYTAMINQYIYAEFLKVTGSTGEANVTIDGIVYPLTLSEANVALTNITDLEHSIANWVNENYTELAKSKYGRIRLSSKAEVDLSGTTGTANITITVATLGAAVEDAGSALLATFNTDLNTTASDFVTSHSAALTARGVTVIAKDDKLIFTANNKDVAINASIANASGDLTGVVSHGVEIRSDFNDQIDVSIANVSGDFAGSVTEDYSAAELVELLASSTYRSFGYMAYNDAHYHAGGGNSGRARNVTLKNCTIKIYKKKGVGAKVISRVEENLADRIGFTKFDNLYIIDLSGAANTTALVHGRLTALAQAKSLIVDGLHWSTDAGIVQIGDASYSAINIIRNTQ